MKLKLNLKNFFKSKNTRWREKLMQDVIDGKILKVEPKLGENKQ